MRVAFAVPGPLDGSTGGYLYDEKVVEALRGRHEVEVVEVPPRSCPADALARLRGYDVVLQDELCYPTLTAVNPAIRAPVVSVVHLLASEDPTRGRSAAVERLYMSTVDACVYTSAASRKASPVDVPSVVARPASRFGTAVDEDEVRKRATEDVLRAAFVGNISGVKGLDTAVRAVAQTDGWELSVAGEVADEKYGRRVRNTVASEGVKDRVSFVGFLNDGELSDLLARSHVVVVPSLYESFGTVYVEGMSFGLPAVGSAAGGAREVIDHGRNGWLVEPERVDSVSEVLSELSEDRGLLAEAGVEALETAERHPSWEETSRKAVKFVERLGER